MDASVTLLSQEAAWQQLPRAIQGGGQPLPLWALAIVSQLPRTTAAMLQLDYAHRTKSPLPPSLRAIVRKSIAELNQCSYAVQISEYDLEQSHDVGPLDLTHRYADEIEFAKYLSQEAPKLPDALFAQLRQRYGDKGIASLVLLTAYANFQDRLLLGLQLSKEDPAALAPMKVEFVTNALQRTPLFPATSSDAFPRESISGVDTVNNASYLTIQERLQSQRNRHPRLPIPTWQQVQSQLPSDLAAHPTRIVWSLMTYGYAAELQVPWTISTRTHWAERPLDRVFEESLFWIQTNALHCNYCMGHCEMLLEVAGLNKAEVANRVRRLSNVSEAGFTPAEQIAFTFATKLTLTPWLLNVEDFAQLQTQFGAADAMSMFWWLCRGLYMTRISDGFQLPLEKENVFG